MTSYKHHFFLFLSLIVLLSCNRISDLPDASVKIEVNQRTKPFTFSEEKEIVWEEVDPKTIQPPQSYPLDLDKLPVRPFSMPQFQPLRKPLKLIFSIGTIFPIKPLYLTPPVYSHLY
ncbi:MAG: hypothetical protein H6561_17075 [Lewinellaceae bacterium]|nr:hypothetical protein [Lewinellaceae bacterium]